MLIASNLFIDLFVELGKVLILHAVQSILDYKENVFDVVRSNITFALHVTTFGCALIRVAILLTMKSCVEKVLDTKRVLIHFIGKFEAWQVEAK